MFANVNVNVYVPVHVSANLNKSVCIQLPYQCLTHKVSVPSQYIPLNLDLHASLCCLQVHARPKKSPKLLIERMFAEH